MGVRAGQHRVEPAEPGEQGRGGQGWLRGLFRQGAPCHARAEDMDALAEFHIGQALMGQADREGFGEGKEGGVRA